jgi:hypothetical protein
VLLGKVRDLAEDVAVRRAEGMQAGRREKVRGHGEVDYAARSWPGQQAGFPRRVLARVEAGPQGTDCRFVISNLAGTPEELYENVYCTRGEAENLIKAHKRHLASDRTSCSSASANQFRLLVHTAAYWLMHTQRGLAPKLSFWRAAQFDTLRVGLLKVAARVNELATRIKVALPSAFPYQETWGLLARRAMKLPP